MAIRVELPNGSIVEIDTDDEKIARDTANDYLKNNPEFNESNYDAVADNKNVAKGQGQSSIDMGTATFEELQAFSRKGKKVVNPADAKIDYKTGIKDAGIRYNLAKKETIDEKLAYLNDIYGEGNVRQDSKGELIVNQDGKEVAVDEEGTSRYDFVDFAGQGGLALPVAIGASILTGGSSLLFSVPLVAGASYGAKILDEYWETQQGYQRQTNDEVNRDALYEALFAGGGEIVGRGISRAFGLLIKSRGPQKIGEETADQARSRIAQIVKDGGRPTIDEATGAPILGRLQAIYEGVFPNRGAAKANANYVMNQINKVKADLNLSDDVVDGLKKELNDEISKQFDDASLAVGKQQAEVQTIIKEQTQRVIKAIRGGADDVEMRDSINLSYKTFQNHADKMYGEANTILKGQAIIPAKQILETLKAVDQKYLGIGFDQTKWAKKIKELTKDKNGMLTVEEANSLRAALNTAGFDPHLIGGNNSSALAAVKSSLNQAFDEAELAAAVSKDKNIAKGFLKIKEANKFYNENVEFFKSTSAAKLIQNTKDGLGFNPIKDMETIIRPNSGSDLIDFLKAVKGYDTKVASKKYVSKTLEENFKKVQTLNVDDPSRLAVEAEMKAALKLAEDVNRASQSGQQVSDTIRKNLGQTWFEETIRKSIDPNGKLNGSLLQTAVKGLGDTKKVLFKPQEAKLIDDFIKQIHNSGDTIDETILQQLADEGLPISQSVQKLKQLTDEADLIKKDKFLNTINTKILDDPDSVVDYVFRSGRAQDITKLKNTIKSKEGTDAIEQIAMQKILSSAGDPAGANFIKIVKSGSGAKALQTKLEKIGDESLTAMFGKERTDLLFKLAKNMSTISDQAIAGKGGLAPASIAVGLSLAGIIANPIAGLTTAGSFFVMSKLLRSGTFLKIATSPRAPGGDSLGLAFQEVHEAMAQFGGETIQRGQEETRDAIQEVQSSAPVQQAVNQAPDITTTTNNKISNIFNQARGDVSPILVPNASTRAAVGSQ